MTTARSTSTAFSSSHSLSNPTSTSSSSSSSLPFPNTTKNQFSRSQISNRISTGETLVLHRRRVYKLDSWLQRHPGGQLAILHFVGRDATCEIEAYHSEETLQRMKRFSIGWIRESDWYSKEDLNKRKKKSNGDVQMGEGEEDSDGNWEWNSTNWKPLTPPVQLGYRNGKLEHEMAQIDAWNQVNRLEEEEEERKDALQVDSSLSSSDLHLSSSPDSDDSDSNSNSNSNSSKDSISTSITSEDSSSSNPHKDRPLTLPISPSLLEPTHPPSKIDPTRESELAKAYLELHSKVKSSGLYDLKPTAYLHELLRYSLLGYLSFHFFQLGTSSNLEIQSTSNLLISSLFLGLLWHQLTFTAHDSGHSGITHIHWLDKSIGILIADFIGGLSLGWWCDNHDVHHLVTNHPEHDPDIQHMPFFAISDKFVGFDEKGKEKSLNGSSSPNQEGKKSSNSKSKSKSQPKPDPSSIIQLSLWSSYYRRFLLIDKPSLFLLKFQHFLYYPIMSLGRFNLYANSYGFLSLKAKRDRWLALEVVGLVFFWVWFGRVLSNIDSWGNRILYALISHIVTSPLHVQIVLSHFARSTADLSLYESFPSRQIRTTMDVKCPPFLDFIHGGLQMQVTHHLFPRLPRHNLRKCRDDFIKPFSKKHGLDYVEYGFGEGNGMVLDTLRNVAGQVRILCKVAEADRKGELHH